jgi:hypothetical protein
VYIHILSVHTFFYTVIGRYIFTLKILYSLYTKVHICFWNILTLCTLCILTTQNIVDKFRVAAHYHVHCHAHCNTLRHAQTNFSFNFWLNYFPSNILLHEKYFFFLTLSCSRECNGHFLYANVLWHHPLQLLHTFSSLIYPREYKGLSASVHTVGVWQRQG